MAETKPARSERWAMVVVVVAIVALMEIGSLLAPAYVVPPPLVVLRALWHGVTVDALQILVTLIRLVAAMTSAILIGSATGLAMGMLAWLRPYLRALVIIDTGIPALSWMLVVVFWFRNPETRIFFIITIIVVPIYALNVYEGIRAMPKDWLEMCESFRPSRWQVLRYLVLPQIVPYVLLTTKSTIGYATRMLIFAELIGSAIGIGARMGLAEADFHIDAVIAWTVLLVALNLLAQAGVTLLEKRLLRWRPEANVR